MEKMIFSALMLYTFTIEMHLKIKDGKKTAFLG